MNDDLVSNGFFGYDDETPERKAERAKIKAEYEAKLKDETERIQAKKKAVAKEKREAKLRQQAIDNLSPKSTVRRNSDGKIIREF